jgi:hypothetical protein
MRVSETRNSGPAGAVEVTSAFAIDEVRAVAAHDLRESASEIAMEYVAHVVKGEAETFAASETLRYVR